MSARPALRTLLAIIFAASARSYRIPDSSPVASGCSFSCSMMKRSIVTTEVAVCLTTVTRPALVMDWRNSERVAPRHTAARRPRSGWRNTRAAAIPRDTGVERTRWLETAERAGSRARAVPLPTWRRARARWYAIRLCPTPSWRRAPSPRCAVAARRSDSGRPAVPDTLPPGVAGAPQLCPTRRREASSPHPSLASGIELEATTVRADHHGPDLVGAEDLCA